jgi:branched-chain amino acid transport system ATP-binding protein
VRPQRGRILLNGSRIDGHSTPAVIAAGVASIPEGRRVFPDMTVWENLELGAYVRRREASQEIEHDLARVLDMFPLLGERRRQAAGTLSGGEQQMLAIARAWMRRPTLLCIDEPSMGLSPLWVKRVYEVLGRLKDDRVTILMVEQNANQALAFADRGYVLRNGEIVLKGLADELVADPEVQRAYFGGAA